MQQKKSLSAVISACRNFGFCRMCNLCVKKAVFSRFSWRSGAGWHGYF